MDAHDTSVVAAVSMALGAAGTGISRYFLGERRIDKVDAVVAITQAYEKVIDQMNKRLETMERRNDYLEKEMRKRDDLIFNSISGRRNVPPTEGESHAATTLLQEPRPPIH